MGYLKIGGIVGAGGIGVLSAGIIVSNVLQIGSEWIFAVALIIFVSAGAISLIARSLK
ncbi:hypothetical protein GOV14_04455 [Candidatus Pacearchaeota archaeon]|nr:hypothetical protein [Candidatus Pacearchaeota archaeon]